MRLASICQIAGLRNSDAKHFQLTVIARGRSPAYDMSLRRAAALKQSLTCE